MTAAAVEITALTVYPVKSMRGIALDSAVLTPLGLEHDRRFMVVRPDGSFVTQRDTPLLALVETALEADGVVLSRDGFGELFVPFDVTGGEPVQTRVWKDGCEAVDQGEVVSRWLTGVLESKERLHLVAMAKDYVRPQGKADLLGSETRTLFADAAPFLVASEDSLARLNRELVSGGHDAVPMNRFRPNVVIRGLYPFAEHTSGRISTESWSLQLRYPCERCIVTTIDQDTAQKNPGKEPYRTLRNLNPMPGKDRPGPAFGQNATLAAGAGRAIRTGDQPILEEY
jgi:uncharacterized protein YcbX